MGIRRCLAGGVLVVGVAHGSASATPIAFDDEARAPLAAAGGALAAADFDEDGQLDLAAVASDGSVSLWLGAGATATAQPARVVSSAGALASTRAVSAEDFDGDGRIDLLVAGVRPEGGCAAVLRRGQGGGAFEPGVVVAAPAPSYAGCSGLEAGDFDQDGNLDFALIYFYQPPETNNGLNGAVDVSLGAGAGAFVLVETHELSAGGTLPYYSPAATQADVDADGALDLVFAAEVRWLSGPAQLRLQTLRGDGTGHFAPGPLRDFECRDCDLVAADASDQTGDGFADVVVATHLGFDSDEYPFPVLFFENDGAGGFSEPRSVLSESGSVSVELADVAADGLADIVSTNVSGRVTVLPALGPGSFGPPRRSLSGGGVAASLTTDVDGDGRLDLALLDATEPELRLARGSATRAFSLPPLTPLSSIEPEISVVDVDADGVLDVLVAGWERVDVLLGDGAGGFVASASLPMSAAAWRVPAQDLDGDGAVDLVLPTADGFALARGRPGPSFELPAETAGAWRDIAASAWGDADGDGDGDIAAYEYAGVVGIYLQGEDHVFARASELPVDLNVYELAFADLNTDGIADLYVGDWGSGLGPDGLPLPGRSLVWLGDGGGHFGLSLPVEARGVRHLLVDVDRDGVLDLVTPDALLVGRGDGSFGGARPLPSVDANDMAVADFDGDGWVDLAYGDNGSVWLARGEGAGGFEPPRLVRRAHQTLSLVAANLSGSVLPDLVSVRTSYVEATQSAELVVFTNQTPVCSAAGPR